MTENWAAAELTEEQTAEMAKEQAEASDTEPAQLNPRAHEDQDNPPQVDHRSASERLIEESEKADKKEEDVTEKTVETETSERTEVTDKKEEESAQTRQEGDIDTDWFRALPDEAKGHYRGLKSEMARIREQRQNEREDSERRINEMMESLPERITRGIKESQPPLPEPDSDEDPEAFKAYHAQRTADAEAIAKDAGERSVVSQDEQKLLAWMARQESDDPEFKTYFGYLYDKMVDQKVSEGRGRKAAENETRQIGINAGRALMNEEGGDWVKAVRHAAVQAGWKANGPGEVAAIQTKTSGEETAATIAAGEKSAKTLGKGGSGASMGELTIEDITNITDPEEHAKAYQAWVDKQTGNESGWTP